MDHREMTALAGDPPRLRALASHLLKYAADDLGEGSRKFLADLAAYDGSRRLNVAALEALDGLRERSRRYTCLGPYRVGDLIGRAYERRLDLLDDDGETWLAELKGSYGPGRTLSRSEALRLLCVCRQLDVIAPGEWIAL